MMLGLAIACLLISCLPALMVVKNLPIFMFPGRAGTTGAENPGAENPGAGEKQLQSEAESESREMGVSVLIPARDEQDGIAASVNAALENQGVDLEVLVLDDHSMDRTPEIVQQIAAQDSRVRYLQGDKLPSGWNGKQFGCKQLAEAAHYPLLVFIDADVRLKPDALQRLVTCYESLDVGLLSAFPRQETETILEKCIIPLMHFVLLGFCPLERMRSDASPALAAGCGQLFLTSKKAYETAGTHEQIRGSRHDGVKLPRAYRHAGLMTDVYDGSDLAVCRMYHSASEVVRGVLKNATEGLASPRLILPFTVLLLGGSVFPVGLCGLAIYYGDYLAAAVAGLATLVGHVPRVLAALRLRQSWAGVICHVPATTLFILLQWVAFMNQLTGRQVAWRGRVSS